MIKIYFIRHFPTDSNNSNVWCGSGSDLNIDKAKINICVESLKDLKNIKFDYVYISPLKRCKQTYEALGLKTQYVVDKRIIERDFGLIEQTPCTDSIKNLLGDWDSNSDLNKNVEKLQSMYFNKVLPFINDLKSLPDNSNVLIIAHSWIGRLLKYYFTNNKEEIKIAPKNGQLLKFELKK